MDFKAVLAGTLNSCLESFLICNQCCPLDWKTKTHIETSCYEKSTARWIRDISKTFNSGKFAHGCSLQRINMDEYGLVIIESDELNSTSARTRLRLFSFGAAARTFHTIFHINCGDAYHVGTGDVETTLELCLGQCKLCWRIATERILSKRATSFSCDVAVEDRVVVFETLYKIHINRSSNFSHRITTR